MPIKNMTHSFSHSLILVIHNNINPSAFEWESMVEDMKKVGSKMRGVLVYTEGGSPNALQRKQLRDALNPDANEVAPMVILTTSVMARMAVTAFNLFFKNRLQAIEPSNYQEGFHYLGIAPSEWPKLITALDDLAKTITLKIPHVPTSNAQL
jgi:hypothetical protein